MVEQLRQRGMYNNHIVPVFVLLEALRHENLHISEVSKILKEYKLEFSDLHYLIDAGVLYKEDGYLFLEQTVHDEAYDINVVTNVKTILRIYPFRDFSLYTLCCELLLHYPPEDIPYIIDLAQEEGIVGEVFIYQGMTGHIA